MEEKEIIKEEKKETGEPIKSEPLKEMPKPKKPKHNKELESLKAENAALKDKMLRIVADSQNMRRRCEEENARIKKYEGEDLAKQLLIILKGQ